MEVECLALKDLTSPRRGSPEEEEEEEEEEEGRGEHKENICVERRRSTPMKAAESPGLLLSRKAPPPDLAHVTPIKHAALAEPWTPTANLKMLISAAGPDIRDREMKKVLFRPIENERAAPESPDTELEDSCQFEAVDEEDDADKKPSRKQKSLGLLCQKFLALYPDYPPPHSPIWISLDEVASSLGVERRRIYDIVNVLESLAIVGRIAKNSYTWYGRLRLDATLEELQRRGRQQGYHLQTDPPASGGAAGREDDGADGGNAGGNRKDKSLRIMSQKFVMLFLVSKTQTVTLDAAARILIEEGQDSSSHSKYKTKVRRLYDIANVLTSLGLIKKVHVREERGRKPAFKWLGPVDFTAGHGVGVAAASLPEATQPMAGLDPRRAKMARHASFNAPPSAAAERRLVNSAPSSPRRDGLPTQPVDYSKKTTSNSAVCRLQFGNGTEPRPTAGCSPQAPPPASRAPPLHPEQLFAASPSPHCLAYLPSLSQPSVVMLYRASEGLRSPGAESDEGRKRRREEEGTVGKRKGCDESAAPQGDAAPWSPAGLSRTSPRELEPPPPSHYLYVPNNAGLNGLNFLLSAAPPPHAGLALPHGGVPTLALPYVLVPSATLAHYPPGPEAHRGNLSFSVPAHFMVGAGPYGQAAPSEYAGPAVPLPSTPAQSRLYGLVAPHSPSGGHHTAGTHTPEPLTPHTPKEAARSASNAFFQTPGTLGSGVSVAPAARRRGSAQRRLDVGHPPGNRPVA